MHRATFTALALVFLQACASTSAVLLDSSTQYPPTTSVQLLTELPTRPYKRIALLEARGAMNMPMPELLESLKQKAAALGADAVIPTEDASFKQSPGLIYNSWLGGYQTIGGGNMPVMRGVAIKFTGP